MGASELGYGDGDEATVIEFDGNLNGDFGGEDKPITTYFRRSFTASDITSIEQLSLYVVRDDGAAVYLNGVEIVRDNVPAGAAFDTPADVKTSGDDERVFHTYAIDPNLLVEGKNVLAVEIHQYAADSSDLSMDARLTAVRSGPSSVLSNDSDAEGDPLTAILTTPPRHGTLTLLPGGSIVYVPETGFVGSDSFIYQVSDGNQQSSDVIATIVVSDVNNPPVAEDNIYSTVAGRPLTVEIPTFSEAQDSPQVLIAAGDPWAFLDDGSDQRGDWIYADFDDSSWSVGRGEFGYGDGDETTIIDYGPDPNNKYTTTYFRHTFFVDDANAGSLELHLLRDDGAAVYLNGTEIARHRLAADAAYDTFAVPKSRGEEERTFHVVAVDPSLLVAGENVIAVEIHQHDLDTSDMSFNLMLSQSSIGLLDNDHDPENDPLTAYLVDQPTGGSVDLQLDGTFTYIPNPGFVGVDTFTYVANDGTNDSNVATVSVTVSASAVPADLTGDGFVDFQDLTILLAHWNQNVSASSGNLVGPLNSPVDFQDLTFLLAGWTGPGPAASPQGAAAETSAPRMTSGSTPETATTASRSATNAHFDRLGRRDRATSRRTSHATRLRRLQAAAVDRAMVEEAQPPLASGESVFIRRRRR